VITINYTANIPGPELSSCAPPTISIVASGETPEALKEDLDRKVKALGAWNVTAVGLHNSRENWIAAFGGKEIDHCAFADTQFHSEPVKKSMWKSLFGG
jgi:hypothetical protein